MRVGFSLFLKKKTTSMNRMGGRKARKEAAQKGGQREIRKSNK